MKQHGKSGELVGSKKQIFIVKLIYCVIGLMMLVSKPKYLKKKIVHQLGFISYNVKS